VAGLEGDSYACPARQPGFQLCIPRRQQSYKIIQILGKARTTLGFLCRPRMDMKMTCGIQLTFSSRCKGCKKKSSYLLFL